MPLPVESIVVELVRFPVQGFSLEGRLAYAEDEPPVGLAVLAGPHPLLGGDLENNVVQGLLHGLARRGIAVLAFNYRGIGDSDGRALDPTSRLIEFWSTSHVSDEPDYAVDLGAAVGAARVMVGPNLPLGVIGYSFGCSILPTCGVADDVPLVLVAPALDTHDFTPFVALKNPLFIVAPEGDFAADAGRLKHWYETLTGRKQLVRGVWDAHFFRGHEERLSELVAAYLQQQWEGTSCR